MSFSVPTSPAVPRSAKGQPVTPQRHARQHPRSQSFYRSPLTPPTTSPYTPISLRSLDSTGSSTLTTPDSFGSGLKKRLAFADTSRNSVADIAGNWRSRANENGIKVEFAPQADSSYAMDDSSDVSFSDFANTSLGTTVEEILAPPFASTHRRMNSMPVSGRPRAQSQASLPSARAHPMSPTNLRSLHRASPLQTRRAPPLNQLLSTPPPNRALARQLKLKGSVTDPAQPRRREVLGNLPTSMHNPGHRQGNMSLCLGPDTSMDLFDIDETEFEQESEYQGLDEDSFFGHGVENRSATSFGYQPLPDRHHAQFPMQPAFMDPFHQQNANGLFNGRMLNSIAENLEHQFQAVRQQQSPLKPFFEDMHQPAPMFYAPVQQMQPQFNPVMHHQYPASAFPSLHQPAMMPFQQPIASLPQIPAESSFAMPKPAPSPAAPAPILNPTDCSVCLASRPASLAILQPCRHPLCSTCLTSALNIVGEKDMECAVCKQSVADFKLVMGGSKGDSSADTRAEGAMASEDIMMDQSNLSGKSFMDPLFSSSSGSSDSFDGRSDHGALQSAFEFGLDLGELRASTPKMEQMVEHADRSMASRRAPHKSEDNVVLRIDNVPWDITPGQINKWLQQPTERVHVLLDGKGKTMSHAYVEVRDAATAGAILRGEARPSGPNGKKERGSVLGRGRRARGVTITRSGQQELMNDLFPHWRGGFDGARPSLAGLEGERVIGALEGGLLTEQYISGLLHLIREPDSHFLKVPSLPFHSLVSVLLKLPTDVDSRVFWTTNVRDMLFDTTCTAIQIILPRITQAEGKATSANQEAEYTMDLAIEILHAALACHAFTPQQQQRLVELAQAYSLPLPSKETPSISPNSSVDLMDGSSLSTPSALGSAIRIASRASPENPKDGSIDDLAKEFGIDAHVVEALAQRLAKLA